MEILQGILDRGGIAEKLVNKNINIAFCNNNGQLGSKSDTNSSYCAGGIVGETSENNDSIVISNCENNAKISDSGEIRRNYKRFNVFWLYQDRKLCQ